VSLVVETLEARRVLSITLAPVGGYETGIFNDGAAEGVGYSVAAERLFVANQANETIDVVDASNPHLPTLEFSIDVSSYGDPTSVATHGNLVAVAIPNGTDETLPGVVLFLDAHSDSPVPLKVIEVGPVPDHAVFTPDGNKVLTANEGQPGDTVDPEGSISVIDVSQGVANATERKILFGSSHPLGNPPGLRGLFEPLLERQLRAQGVRFLSDRPAAQSLEPEYIAVHPNSNLAWVTLQENNAVAMINLQSMKVNWIKGLGYKDHSLPENAFDPSDRDSGIHIGTWPVLGAYQPDGITAFSDGNELYLATANEGDAFGGENARVSTLDLDNATFPNEAALKTNSQLGRLNVSRTFGDTDSDGDIDRLYSSGARSFTVWTTDAQQVFDSGDDFEQITAATYPANFNASNTNNTLDDRSDDKGPEPSTVVVGAVGLHKYAFVTVERTGGIMVYDVTAATMPSFVQYINTRDFSKTPGPGMGGDLHPENLVFVAANDSPTGKPLLVVSYQVSGSVRIFEISQPIAAVAVQAAIADANVDGDVPITSSDPINFVNQRPAINSRVRPRALDPQFIAATDRGFAEPNGELASLGRRDATREDSWELEVPRM
jgi:hypothetical protein